MLARSARYWAAFVQCVGFPVVLLMLANTGGLSAQERIEGIAGAEQFKTQGAAKRAGLRDLPFFDDFANGGPAPQSVFWEEKSHVTVHRHGAVGNPTPGVATFDIALSDGLFPPISSSGSLCVDMLESVGVNLTQPDDTTVYLSFCYQPGGYGEPPTESDSLCLDFYSVLSARWINVWRGYYSVRQKALLEEYFLPYLNRKERRIEGDSLCAKFHLVHIPLRGADLLKPGFKFRFRGQSSVRIDPNTPGVASNSRRWNLDLVYINNERHWDDTSIYDVSATYLSPLTIAGYSTVPMEALKYYAKGQGGEPFKQLTLRCRNFTSTPMNVGAYFRVEDLQAPKTVVTLQRGHDIVPPKGEWEATRSIGEKSDFDWSVPLGRDSLTVRLKGYIMLGDEAEHWPFRYNDTIEQLLTFSDAYGYDGGSPDLGYGIVGRGAERANVAMRFEPIVPTAIRAVRIWYNPLVDPSSRKQQRLAIWADEGGVPGALLYSQNFQPPADNGKLGRFVEIPLDTALDFSAPLFVGWRQSENDFVNVGYEQRPATEPIIYFQTTGGWLRSELKGTLLLRLVCGGAGTVIKRPVTPVEEGRIAPACRVYPNPCRDFFHLEVAEPYEKVEVLDPMGRVLRSYPAENGDGTLGATISTLSSGDLGRGVRLVRVFWRDGRYAPSVLKLLVQ